MKGVWGSGERMLDRGRKVGFMRTSSGPNLLTAVNLLKEGQPRADRNN